MSLIKEAKGTHTSKLERLFQMPRPVQTCWLVRALPTQPDLPPTLLSHSLSTEPSQWPQVTLSVEVEIIHWTVGDKSGDI